MAKNGRNLPAKMGRPTKYTEELVLKFCLELAEGASVHQLCKRPEYPSEDTIYRWLNEREDFSEKYRIARELQADRLADEIVLIADGKMPMEGVPEAPDTAARVSRDTLRIKTLMWQAGRMSPRKWGELV
jgi:hypothetical protein